MKRILCATDLSEPADEALRQASDLARDVGARLGVCHLLPVANPLHPLSSAPSDSEPLTDPALTARITEALKTRTTSITGRDSSEVEVFVEIGAGYAELLRRAETWRADVVVAASRGLSGLQRVLLGSVASQVVRYAHCPVLVARSSPKGPVVAATDLSDAALPAVQAAAREAKRREVELVVVHALGLSPAAAMWAALGTPFGAAYSIPSAETVARVQAAARTTLEAALARFDIDGTIVVPDGSAATSIVVEAERREASLVVVGTHGRTGFARVALGSVAEKVIQNAHCSVLAVRLAS